MRLRFNQEVRHTIASELRKVSTFGGIALGVLGYSSGSPVVLAGAFLWWVARLCPRFSWPWRTT